MDLYDLFEELKDLFKEEDLESWISREFNFTREGELEVSFDYINWISSEFGQVSRQNCYEYRESGILPETEYEINKAKGIEQYVKELEE